MSFKFSIKGEQFKKNNCSSSTAMFFHIHFVLFYYSSNNVKHRRINDTAELDSAVSMSLGSLHTVPIIISGSAEKSSLSRLEQMQQDMSGFCFHIWPRNQTHTVASAPTVIGSVFMRILRLFLRQCDSMVLLTTRSQNV